MRIVSLLPAATEMAFALGLGDAIAAVSHECDYPDAARNLPVVVRSALSLAALAPNEIDSVVAAAMRDAGTLYAVDETLLRTLAPTHILTQDLCQVCAPSGNAITRTLATLQSSPEILYFTPRTLADVHDNLRTLGDATGRRAEADAIVASNEARLARIAARVATIGARPRVFFAEWTDPLYCAGHWIPEMIELAGATPVVARPGGESVRVTRDEARASEPDVVIVAPCGFSIDDAVRQASLVDVPADRVFAVDANAYFARPGPRLVDGVELLAALLHPSLFEWTGAPTAYRPVES